MISLTGGKLDKRISGFLHPVLFTEVTGQAVLKRAYPGKRTGNGKAVIQVAVGITDLAEIGFDPLLIGQARIDLDATGVHQFSAFAGFLLLVILLTPLPGAAVIDPTRDANCVDSFSPAHTGDGFLNHVADRLVGNTKFWRDVLRASLLDKIEDDYMPLLRRHVTKELLNLPHILPLDQVGQTDPGEIAHIAATVSI